MRKTLKVFKYGFIILFLLFLVGMIIPQNLKMPVEGAGLSSEEASI